MAKKTISESKRKQLEAAGYTVSKSGQTVRTKDGGTVAGINDNGNFFGSANSKAFKILKGEEAKPKAETKATPKAEAKSSAPKSTSTRPQARRTEGQIRSSSGGPTRYTPTEVTNDGGPRRGSRKPKSESKSPSAMTEAPTLSGNQTSSGGAPINRPKPDSEVKAGYGSLANAKNRMESFKVSRQDKTINGVSFNEWRKLTRAERVEKNLPLTNQEFMRAMRLKGFNKGGMVKSGSKDYKKSGMFYKSASPRGYK